MLFVFFFSSLFQFPLDPRSNIQIIIPQITSHTEASYLTAKLQTIQTDLARIWRDSMGWGSENDRHLEKFLKFFLLPSHPQHKHIASLFNPKDPQMANETSQSILAIWRNYHVFALIIQIYLFIVGWFSFFESDSGKGYSSMVQQKTVCFTCVRFCLQILTLTW